MFNQIIYHIYLISWCTHSLLLLSPFQYYIRYNLILKFICINVYRLLFNIYHQNHQHYTRLCFFFISNECVGAFTDRYIRYISYTFIYKIVFVICITIIVSSIRKLLTMKTHSIDVIWSFHLNTYVWIFCVEHILFFPLAAMKKKLYYKGYNLYKCKCQM